MAGKEQHGNTAPGNAAPDDDLFLRRGLPDELTVLSARYPRSGWEAHRNLGPMARFWLERHGMFRALAAHLIGTAQDFREDRLTAQAFLPTFAPRYNLFIQELHMHHRVEDQHYFPIFRTADPRLARGFDILDADHHAIDALIHRLAEAGQALQRTLEGEGDGPRAKAALAEALAKTLPALTRHLDDEEDLVIPLILERTEAALGV